MDGNSMGLGIVKAKPEAAGTCATCGRPLTQCGPNGECLRCLISLTFLADGEQPERPAAHRRLTPGPTAVRPFRSGDRSRRFSGRARCGSDGHNLPCARYGVEL